MSRLTEAVQKLNDASGCPIVGRPINMPARSYIYDDMPLRELFFDETPFIGIPKAARIEHSGVWSGKIWQAVEPALQSASLKRENGELWLHLNADGVYSGVRLPEGVRSADFGMFQIATAFNACLKEWFQWYGVKHNFPHPRNQNAQAGMHYCRSSSGGMLEGSMQVAASLQTHLPRYPNIDGNLEDQAALIHDAQQVLSLTHLNYYSMKILDKIVASGFQPYRYGAVADSNPEIHSMHVEESIYNWAISLSKYAQTIRHINAERWEKGLPDILRVSYLKIPDNIRKILDPNNTSSRNINRMQASISEEFQIASYDTDDQVAGICPAHAVRIISPWYKATTRVLLMSYLESGSSEESNADRIASLAHS